MGSSRRYWTGWTRSRRQGRSSRWRTPSSRIGRSVSTDPAAVRAQINQAEKRAGQRQVRLLIVALIGLGVIAAFAVAGFFLAYSQARKNADLTHQVIAQNAQIKSLTEQLA